MQALTSNDPAELGWLPHRPETWTYRFAKLKQPLVLQHYTGRFDKEGRPIFRGVPCEVGTPVKIVMVSRFGDVGITENLTAENGYGARVLLNELYDFSVDAQSLGVSLGSEVV